MKNLLIITTGALSRIHAFAINKLVPKEEFTVNIVDSEEESIPSYDNVIFVKVSDNIAEDYQYFKSKGLDVDKLYYFDSGKYTKLDKLEKELEMNKVKEALNSWK